ncbi:molecular chaperone TorD family protein [Corynebacterium sp. Q4381]|uniref:TorD/DmsD family molecular chaperone n=1 Tax=Corynebacterium sp. Marseille-Q4381 TaxID=3121597 RepID=UPI002FE53547
MDTEHAQRLSLAADIVGQLFLDEPSPEMLQALTNPDLLADWPLQDASSRAAATSLIERAECGRPDTVEDLKRDHLYLFIGAGTPLAQPYESPYFSPDGLVLDGAAAEVEAAYKAVGFNATKQWGNLPPDHLGLELRCIAHVAGMAAGAASVDERERLVGFLRSFTASHPARFADQVLDGVQQHAATGVYQALPSLTRGVLHAALRIR